MKKIILLCGTIVFIIVGTIICKKASMVEMSDLTLANIEALANGESGSGQRIICYNKLKGLQGAPMEDKTWCSDCSIRPASEWSQQSECYQ